MHFMPIDVNTVEPQSGGSTYPEGFFLVQIEDATQTQAEKDGVTMKQVYKTRIVMGPGWLQEYAGRVFNDRIRNTPDWAGRHMELACAALGSKEAVRQVASQHGGRLPGEVLHGRMYIVQLSVNGTYNNVIQRIPYTQEAWTENAGQQAAQQLVTPQAPQAPAPQYAAPQMPQAPQYAAPQAPAPQMPGYPPAPQYAAPQMPQAPQYAAPQAPAPQMPQYAAPTAPPAPPAPPPPPGMPAAPR